ncbi:hypothetical protein F8388_005105 [Cannabis sativa]|uniref:Uncharacterized protein n=1 Tax=Cannabis sativa TaxID=3483 RepID=A0A7J6I514_CANSA|nr:hypothetical protein F8388_005105 [Cannabis sativa]KAF4402109.1 hypothetical protein G4B88_017621 [Cannabis sativa]
MEKKKKEHKLASAYSQEPDTNDHSNKEDQDEQTVGNNIKTLCPSNDNATSENNHHTPVLQWPYTPQNNAAVDQSPLASKPHIHTQSPSPVIISQWHFPHQHQQNLTNLQVPQGQLPLNYTQPTPPFWLPQRTAHTYPGMNVPSPAFSPYEITWQAPAAGLGSASTAQNQVPSVCYPFGYSYQGLPGPCDPLSLWGQGQGQGQAQQSQPLCTYAFPGTYNYFPSPPSVMLNSSTSTGQVIQRGVIKTTAKLSQKHQQLWDAQSAENVQLWNVINQLQSEIGDYKNQLTRLEAEVSSFKPKVEEPPARTSGTAVAGQPSKRGRPKRSVASVDAGASPDESHRRARARKSATSKVQSETKEHIYEKVVLNKIEDVDKSRQSLATIATIEQRYSENMLNNNAANSSGNVETNGRNLMMPAFSNQAPPQICGMVLTPSSEMKCSSDKSTEPKTAYSILSQQATAMSTNSNRSSSGYLSATVNGNLGWSAANVTSEEAERKMLSIGCQGFYNSNVIRQEGKLVPGWSFVNGEDASEELEDAAVLGSAKDENEEMEEDGSSETEDIVETKDDGANNEDVAVGTSPKGLSPLNNW